MRASRWFNLGMVALAAVVAAGVLLQHQAAAALRTEIGMLRAENQEIARLRAENARLREQIPPELELHRLHSDHAASVRLRAEMASLRAAAETMGRELASPGK